MCFVRKVSDVFGTWTRRALGLNGGRSAGLTLPVEWVRKNNLRPGTNLYMVAKGDILVITVGPGARRLPGVVELLLRERGPP